MEIQTDLQPAAPVTGRESQPTRITDIYEYPYRAAYSGPKPWLVDRRLKQLEAENRRLQRKLQRAETIITLQKTVAEILGIPLKPLDTD